MDKFWEFLELLLIAIIFLAPFILLGFMYYFTFR